MTQPAQTPPAGQAQQTPPPGTPPATPPAAPPPNGQAGTPPGTPPPAVPPAGQEGTPPAPPATLSLKLPEKAVLDAQALERMTAKATTLGLSQELGQQVLEHVNAEVASFQQKQEADAAKMRTETWVQQAQADPEIGGAKFNETVQLSAQARKKFFTPEFDQMLETTGLGNHPEFIRAWSRVGRAMAESTLVQPQGEPPPPPPKTLAQRMYPNMKSETAAS